MQITTASRAQDAHGNALNYLQVNNLGYPLVGQTPLMSSDEIDRNYECHVRFCYGEFDLSDPDQRLWGRTYCEVREHTSAGQWQLGCVPKYSRRDGRPHVYVEWLEMVGKDPEAHYSPPGPGFGPAAEAEQAAEQAVAEQRARVAQVSSQEDDASEPENSEPSCPVVRFIGGVRVEP